MKSSRPLGGLVFDRFPTGVLRAVTVALLAWWSGIPLAAAVVVTTNLPAPPGSHLVVTLNGGAIEVVAHDTGEIRLEAKRIARGRTPVREQQLLSESPLQITKDGTNWVLMTVTPTKEARLANGERPPLGGLFKLWVPKDCSVDLTTELGSIEVRGLMAGVQARTEGGGLRFHEIQAPILGETTSGTIFASACVGTNALVTRGGGIQVLGGSGNLRLESGGGTVVVRRYRGPVHAEVSAGNLEFERVIGALDGLTGSGRIVADLEQPVPGPVRLEASGGGGIVVRVAREAGFSLDAMTSAGFVSLGVGKSAAPAAPTSERREVVNGGGPEVWLRTGAGSIRITPWTETPGTKSP